jgi:hypothetical protein
MTHDAARTSSIMAESTNTADILGTDVLMGAGVCVLVPMNGILLDRYGYGIVLIIINTLDLSTIAFQMITSLRIQVGLDAQGNLCTDILMSNLASHPFTQPIRSPTSRTSLRDCQHCLLRTCADSMHRAL